MKEKSILIVHPNDKTTTFLDKIKNHLIETFGDQVHHFNIYPNDKSHDDCLNRISTHPDNGVIIFLGHGRSDKLYGSKGELYGTFENELVKYEYPEKYYYNENFIDQENIGVFKGKKVFCLSCNSNDKIAKLALETGARCFLGFGDIPTSIGEFEEKQEKVSGDVVTKMKTELNYIVKTSLSLSIQKNLSFESLLYYIQFVTTQRMSDILVNQKLFRERHLLADYLYYLKKEAKITGDRYLKVID